MSEQKNTPFIVSLVFGEPPDMMLRTMPVPARDQTEAVAIAISSAYTDGGETRRLTMTQIVPITPEIIAAVTRGINGPAPVVSLVPGIDQNSLQPMPKEEGNLPVGEVSYADRLRNIWKAPEPDGAA